MRQILCLLFSLAISGASYAARICSQAQLKGQVEGATIDLQDLKPGMVISLKTTAENDQVRYLYSDIRTALVLQIKDGDHGVEIQLRQLSPKSLRSLENGNELAVSNSNTHTVKLPINNGRLASLDGLPIVIQKRSETNFTVETKMVPGSTPRARMISKWGWHVGSVLKMNGRIMLVENVNVTPPGYAHTDYVAAEHTVTLTPLVNENQILKIDPTQAKQTVTVGGFMNQAIEAPHFLGEVAMNIQLKTYAQKTYFIAKDSIVKVDKEYFLVREISEGRYSEQGTRTMATQVFKILPLGQSIPAIGSTLAVTSAGLQTYEIGGYYPRMLDHREAPPMVNIAKASYAPTFVFSRTGSRRILDAATATAPALVPAFVVRR